MRNTNPLTSAAGVQYNITDKSIINEDAILDSIHSLKGMPGIRYNNGNTIKISNYDMWALRTTFKTEESYDNRSEGIIDCISCDGNRGKAHYFYVFYKNDEGSVAPIFRMNYNYVDRYMKTIKVVVEEMGYKYDEFIRNAQANGNWAARIGNIGGRNSTGSDDVSKGTANSGLGETPYKNGERGPEGTQERNTGILNGEPKGNNNRQSGGRGNRSYSIENLSSEQM